MRAPAALVLGAAVLLPVAAAAQPEGEDANHTESWEAWLAEQGVTADCFKHEADEETAHGFITDNGLAVVLNEFDPTWPGDFWALLVVKGGDSNNVVLNPVAVTHKYTAPLNNGGQVPAVSHWITCKGSGTPPTTTTVPETTTTVPQTTTTMNDFIDVPSTTVPSLPPITTTLPPVEVKASSIQLTAEPELAHTGSDRTIAGLTLAAVLVAAGTVAITFERGRRS